uniref:Uncharacterized protein n=1 Tax=Ralstonia solanacearum TaxID=305 RepID=A0A0S4VEJ2_RALSL|nr:protein of unknown function [Ralstonia solanacearum]CUV41789.1 protein of unknown function [Ralstonia solanacearum]
MARPSGHAHGWRMDGAFIASPYAAIASARPSSDVVHAAKSPQLREISALPGRGLTLFPTIFTWALLLKTRPSAPRSMM